MKQLESLEDIEKELYEQNNNDYYDPEDEDNDFDDDYDGLFYEQHRNVDEYFDDPSVLY